MEVAASIVGLMAVGAQVCSTLNSFLAACQDAPIVVETTRDEIRDFHYALERLKDYVWQSEKITPLGRATTDTNQLVLTLASSMKTFAHVEKVLNPLLTQPKMDTLRRLRWARSSGDIEKLLIRIQSHKMTMNLLLTIWLSESTAQAEASNDILNDILKRLVDPNHQAAQVQHFDPTNYEVPTSDTSVEASISGLREGSGKSVYARSFMSVGKSFSIMSGRSLTSKLRNSKAYASPKAFDTSAQSVLSRGATPWSSYTIGSGASVFSLPFSGLELEGKSISQVKEIHRISFPLDGKTLYNEWWYPKADTKSGFPTEGVCTFLAVLGLKGKTQKPGTNGSPSPSTDIKSTIIPPSLIQTSNNELDIYLTKGGKHSSFLKERLRLSITDRHLPSIELLLVWSAQNRFGVSIGDELVDAFRGVVEQGDKYLTELFLNWGAYIEVLYREPDHSIFEGALKSHHSIEIVDLFLVYGADTEKGYGEPSYTPLQAAVIYPLDSSLGLARLLLDRGANNEGFCEEERRTPLELAISGKHYKMITMLLERGADPEKGYGNPPCTPLQAAALGRFDHSLELVKFLLDQGMSIEGCCNEERRKPLELAMASANYEMITMLLDRGADSERGYGEPPCTPLQAASIGRFDHSLELGEFLLNWGVNINGFCNEERRTPLELAMASANYEMITMLLDRGVDPTKSYGDPPCTPLQAAAIGRFDISPGVAQLLLDRGISIEGCCNEEHRTPLELAMASANYEMITMLLDRGVDPTKSYGDPPCTPLQAAAIGRFDNSPGVAQLLLDRGISIEGCCNEEHRTPLELAMASANYEIITMLLDRGVDPEKSYGDPPRTPLQAAAMGQFHESIGLAQFLLDRGVNVEGYIEQEPRTPLQIASDRGDYSMINLLFKSGAELNTYYGKPEHTPLQALIERGTYSTIRLLLEHGANVEKGYMEPRRTPLQAIAEMIPTDFVNRINLLLDWGAKLDGHTDQEPRTPLQIAITLQSLPMAIFLIDRGANVEGNYENSPMVPLQLAAKYGNKEIATLLLDRGANTDRPTGRVTSTPLQIAVHEGNTAVAKLLVDRGANIDAHTDDESRTPLQIALEVANQAMAMFLIDRGAKVEGNYDNSPMVPLQLAAKYGYKEVATLLLDRGANTDRPTGRVTSTPLQIAIQEGNTAVAKLLVDRGAMIDAHTDDEPRTPLQIALEVVNLPMAMFLIDQGANVEGNYDSSPMVPLQLAAKYGNLEIVTELLDRGAKIDRSTSQVASTALQIAVQEGYAEITQLLIARGANMETSSKGAPNTPLQIAVETQSKVIVWILLEGGAELHRCTPEYVCPIHMALKVGSRRIVEMLSTQGVNLVDVCYEESHL